MKKIIILLFIIISNFVYSQDNEIINPTNIWYFGAELGLNTITSIHPEHENSFQAGILAEFTLEDNFSLSARLKYFETGVSNKYDSKNGVFKGSVISLPINANWYYIIYKKFSGSAKLGLALNQEIKSEYNYFPMSQETNYSKLYGTLNLGFGFNYNINKYAVLFINYEVFVLGNDRDKNEGGFNFTPNSPNNNLLNLGIKYRLFKKI